MAAIPLDETLIAKIVADWRTGAFSQQALADKHKVSKGAVNKLCKGVEQDMTAIVTAGIAYNQGLLNQDDRMVTAVTAVVDEAASRMEWLNKAALKNVQEAMKASCENQQDFKHRADTVLKAKEAVFGKAAETVINNTNAQQNNQKITYEVMR
jgi:hypothetical protein